MTPIFALLAGMLGCVPHDPPVHALVEIPRISPRDLPFQTEGEACEVVMDTFANAGMEAATQPRCGISEQVLFAVAESEDVVMRRFLSSPERARALLTEAGPEMFGAAPALDSWTDEELWEAWQALQVGRIAHAVAHAVARRTGAIDLDDAARDELRAREAEAAALRRLVELGRIPASWPGARASLIEALTAPCARDDLHLLATQPDAGRALIRDHYRDAAAWADDDVARRARCAAWGWSISADAAAARSLEALQPDLNPDPLGTLHAVEAALSGSRMADRGVIPGELGDGTVGFRLEGREWQGIVTLSELGDTAAASLTASGAVPAARTPAVLRLVNAANAEGGSVALALRGGVVVATIPEREVDSPVGVANLLTLLLDQADLWFDPIAAVATGKMDEAAALAAVAASRATEETP